MTDAASRSTSGPKVIGSDVRVPEIIGPEAIVCHQAPTPELVDAAARLNIPCLLPDQVSPALSTELCLHWKDERLALGRFTGKEKPVAVDFVAALSQRRQGPELLWKAVGGTTRVKPASVDATAGFGRDSAVMLGRGSAVSMIESNPVVGLLLRDAMRRLQADPRFTEQAAGLELYSGAAEDHLPNLAKAGRCQVIYLDPMFAESGKSALAKKDMQLFQALLGHGDDGRRLLEVALDCAEYRVVVKRALKAEPLAQREPAFAIKGKAVRFDVYPLKSLKYFA